MDRAIVEAEYRRMTNSARAEWSKCQDVGQFIGLPTDYHRLGISLGSLYEPPKALVSLLELLEQIASSDHALTLIPKSCTHFTFLALAGHHWNTPSELPPEVVQLEPLISTRLKNLSWSLENLRIVPGKNYLLLAGIPDQRSQQLRVQLADDLMSSAWRKHVEQRYEYRGFPFPPVIWHTTLCRYQYESLPRTVRALFEQFAEENFGRLILPKPTLRAVTWDWSTAVSLV